MAEAGGIANGTPGIPTATGNLNSTDIDNPADSWAVIGTPTASINGYGTFTIDAAGVWFYTLDNSNAAVQALNIGGTLGDSFTVTSVDGTTQLVTITINGANDAAVITGTVTGTVAEAGGVNNSTPGTPTATGDLNATDVDNPVDAWTAVGSPTASTNGYGSYTLTRPGCGPIRSTTPMPTVQALNVGAHPHRHVHRHHGRRHRPTGDHHHQRRQRCRGDHRRDDGSVIEAGGVGSRHSGHPGRCRQSAMPPMRTTRRTLWTPVATPTPGANSFGTYTLTAAGVVDLHPGQQQRRRYRRSSRAAH